MNPALELASCTPSVKEWEAKRRDLRRDAADVTVAEGMKTVKLGVDGRVEARRVAEDDSLALHTRDNGRDICAVSAVEGKEEELLRLRRDARDVLHHLEQCCSDVPSVVRPVQAEGQNM